MSRRKKTVTEQVESYLLDVLKDTTQTTENRLEAAKQLRQLEADKRQKTENYDAEKWRV